MAEHELKCEPPHFEDIVTGRKGAECRFNDRDYQVGDVLRLREWKRVYSGRELTATVSHILRDTDGPWLQPGYVMLSLANVRPTEAVPDWLQRRRDQHKAGPGETPCSCGSGLRCVAYTSECSECM